MTASFIIAEYNPFHIGHKYHISRTKSELNADVTAIIMSGSMTQRCEPAVISKWERAEMAIRGGADIVFELPFPFSSMSAKSFASAGVFLAKATGADGFLSFGSESGNIEELQMLADALHNPEIDKRIHELTKSGMTYVKARSDAVGEFCGENLYEMLKSPNNILAVEYLSEIKAQNSRIIPFTIAREKTGFHEKTILDGFSGASYIRELIKDNDDSFLSAVPAFVAQRLKMLMSEGYAPCDIENMARGMLFKLRNADSEKEKYILEVSEGLENRIILAARTADSYKKLCEDSKTKRYTMSRIRRAILFSHFSVTKEYLNKQPDYLKVLAFNTKGRSFIKEIKETATLPVITKPADGRTELKSKKTFDLEALATDFLSLSSPKINIALSDYLCGPVYVKDDKI